MDDPATSERLLLVSDLHLDSPAGEGLAAHPYVPAFCRFVDGLAGPATAPGRTRLVILGDLLELRTRPGHRAGPHPVQRLQQVLAHHGPVLGALARFLARGGRLDLVIGNHDLDLGRRDVGVALRSALRTCAGVVPLTADVSAGVTVHRWFLHIPGVLYAEHGHRHHDINAIDRPLAPWGPDDRGKPPRSLSDVLRFDSSPVRAVAFGWRLLLSCLPDPAAGRRRRRYRRAELPDFARATAFPSSVLGQLDRLAETHGLTVARRLAQKTFRGMSSAPLPPDEYLVAAAARIHEILDRAGQSVACYAFGHTHRAATRPLLSGCDFPVYANSGTWSADVRPRPGAGRSPLPSYVEIDVMTGAPPQVAVRRFPLDENAGVPFAPGGTTRVSA